MPRAEEKLEQLSDIRPVLEVVGAHQVTARGDAGKQHRQRALGPVACDEQLFTGARDRHVDDALPLVGQLPEALLVPCTELDAETGAEYGRKK